jgi:hypothetical protein
MNDYLPCDKRKKMVHFQRDGTQKRVQTCTDPNVDASEVTPDVCEACPLRQFTKPTELPQPAQLAKLGEVRKILRTEPDTAAGDGFPACGFRLRATASLCCGQTSTHKLCDSPDSYHYGVEVNSSICNACPLLGGGNNVDEKGNA